jgi:hypothetical protein
MFAIVEAEDTSQSQTESLELFRKNGLGHNVQPLRIKVQQEHLKLQSPRRMEQANVFILS